MSTYKTKFSNLAKGDKADANASKNEQTLRRFFTTEIQKLQSQLMGLNFDLDEHKFQLSSMENREEEIMLNDGKLIADIGMLGASLSSLISNRNQAINLICSTENKISEVQTQIGTYERLLNSIN